MSKILINASNLHNGGGIQVATSFLHELSSFYDKSSSLEIYIFVSRSVHVNLQTIGFDINRFKHYQVFDVFGLQALNPKIADFFYGYDLVFTIFGPLYLPKRIKNHIIGFAQLWILYPDNEVSRRTVLLTRVKNRFKYHIQWLFFNFSATRLVVELPHVKERLIAYKRYPRKHIDVAQNCISSIYFKKEKWLPLPRSLDDNSSVIRIGYLSRAYSHKNIEILLYVAQELKKLNNHRFKFEFYVTLTQNEWKRFSTEFRSIINNLGPLMAAQCPSFYQAMDGVIFTSLLECFSATPLEAMVMRRPLFASERGFVRDVCDSHAIYVDPVNSQDIAQKIQSWFFHKPESEKVSHLEQAYNHVLNLPNSRDRALSYMRIIQNQLELSIKG